MRKVVLPFAIKVFLSLIVIGAVRASAAPASAITPADVERVLSRLDNELEQREHYLRLHEHKIDSLTELLADRQLDASERLRIIEEKGDLYDGYLSDSALVCYTAGWNEAIAAGDKDREIRFKLKSAVCLPLAGFVGDGVSRFESIDLNSLTPELKELALECGRQLYSYVAAFYSAYPTEYDKWTSLSTDLQKRLLEMLDRESPKYLLNQGEYMFMTGRHRQAKAILLELLETVPVDSNIAARAANIISQAAAIDGLKDEQLYYLAISAIADIRSSTREVTSLQQLGINLYESDDIERSRTYLARALDNAVECQAAMRMLQTSKALPVIDKAHQEAMRLGRIRLYMAIMFLVLLMACLIVVLAMLNREMKRMKELQRHLESANKQKEMYMGHFLSLCTVYMDKLNKFCQIAIRKITTGHTDELLRLMKSGRFIGEHTHEFYETFDKAFLHIHPTFIDDVNKLLKPEEQIVPGEGELLNTDLRILAFIRLGVEDSPTIAQTLNYSLHTIYSYRNRLRNRAIDRDNFESDIAGLD